jgi:hypothetical protein
MLATSIACASCSHTRAAPAAASSDREVAIVPGQTPIGTALLHQRPKLLLVVVMDQVRADYITRFLPRFRPPRDSSGKPGGFRWLMESGAYVPYGEFQVLKSLTAVGHSTLMTGAYPYRTGIVGNRWFDREARAWRRVSDDAAFPLVGATKPARGGVSPRSLMGPTLGDTLKNAGLGSRVVAVALKNRAAVLMGGQRADAAVWFHKPSYRFVSSRFYLPEGGLPSWVSRVNERIEQRRGEKLSWTIGGAGSGRNTVERGAKLFGETRVGDIHALGTPFGLQISIDLALAALEAYQLGQRGGPDLLCVGLSSFDYLGHEVGPNDRAIEELVVAADQQLARLFAAIDRKVGLDDVVVLLTSDHGIAPTAQYLESSRQRGGVIEENALADRIERQLRADLGTPPDGQRWTLGFRNLGLVLNRRLAAQAGVDLSRLYARTKLALAEEPGIAHVFSLADYREGRLPPGLYGRQVANTVFERRCADVIAIPFAFYSADIAFVHHMTGYTYDRLVPVFLAGRWIRPGLYPGPIEMIHFAPTLGLLAGIAPPALAEGRVLHHMLRAPASSD